MIGTLINKDSLPRLVESLFVNDADVYEAYSKFDKPLRKFTAPLEILDWVDEIGDGKRDLIFLSIHYPETKGYIKKKAIKLDPKKCNGAKKRF